MTETQDRPLGKKIKHAIESKILVPAAAAIVGAAARYLIKKLPLLLEEKVLPRLREQDLPQPVAKVVEQTAASIDGDAPEQAPDAEEESSMSNDEREEERKKRAQRRRQRKSASAKAA